MSFYLTARTLLLLAAFFLLIASPVFSLQSYQEDADDLYADDFDPNALPVRYIFDPETHNNEPIMEYSFNELHVLLSQPKFRQRNDVEKVCQTMYILYESVSSYCHGNPLPLMVTQRTARAYVDVTILPSPLCDDRDVDDRYVIEVQSTTRSIPTYSHATADRYMLVDPVYPPWSPTYNPYW